MNNQPIEKRRQDDTGEYLEVHSIFHTIQGEGPFCGTPCVFVRLAGCNLQCPGCDTDYSSHRELMHFADIAAAIGLRQRTNLVVITGGEPFRQNLTELLRLLIRLNFYVQIESNGTLAPSAFHYNTNISSRSGAYIVCSPKTGKLTPSIGALACAFKYVLSYDGVAPDGLPIRALGHSAKPHVARPPKNFGGPVYLQPMDSHDEKVNKLNLNAAVNSCIKHGHILQLQIHKLIGVP